MKNTSCFFSVFIALMLQLLSHSMSGQSTPAAMQSYNVEIQSRAERVDPAGWLYFYQNAHVEENQLFSSLKTAMGLGSNDAMVLEKSEIDELGYKHNRYQQFYKNVEVENAEYTEHIRDCYVEIAHGKLAEGLNQSANPVFSENQALQSALTHIGASEYEWQNPAKVAEYQEDMEDSTATLYPKGKLIFAVGPSGEVLHNNYTLVWRFTISATVPYYWKTIAINAVTGAVQSESDPGLKNGPATLLFGYSTNGPTIIDTRKKNGIHDLSANENTRKIETRSGTPSSNFLVKDPDDNWDTPGGLASFTTAHWAASQSWDYWKSKWNHKGPRNNNDKLKVIVSEEVSPDPLEAMQQITQYKPDKNEIIIAPNLDLSIPSTLDVVGHEFTHGVIIKQSGLGNKREPGALGESFANIFGELIERFTFPNQTPEWLFEEDVFGPSSPFIASQSFKSPNASNVAMKRADSVGPFPWTTPNTTFCPDPDAIGADNCFIHTNSGVQDRWFYTSNR